MILVVVDRFTKMAHFIPTRKTATAEQCAKLMVENCFKLHGIPKRMVSDNDIEFLAHHHSSQPLITLKQMARVEEKIES